MPRACCYTRAMTESASIPRAPVRTACAGWSIPRAAAAAFPAHGSHLERYAQVFDAAEINSSFYRPHQLQTYQRWADSVPPGFRFSVKLPRAITHEARLADVAAPLRAFADQVGGLGDKLGCVLVQLPPSLGFDSVVAAEFLARMQDAFACTLALEARNPAWFGGGASALLAGHGVTRVLADPPKGQDGPHVATASTVYLRLHGSPRIYYSAYAPAYLEQLAAEMRAYGAHGRELWCVFDNTLSPTFMDEALLVHRASTR